MSGFLTQSVRPKYVTAQGIKCKAITGNGVQLWLAEIKFNDIAITIPGSPSVVSDTLYLVSSEVMDLSDIQTLTGVATADVGVWYWKGSGDIYSNSSAVYLKLADNTLIPLTPGKVSVDLSAYTAEQKSTVYLCGSVSWSVSTVTDTAFTGSGWSLTNIIGYP